VQVAEPETSRGDSTISKNPTDGHCQKNLQPEQQSPMRLNVKADALSVEAPSKCYH